MPQMPSYLINSSMCCNIHPVQFRLKSSVLSKKHHSPHWLFPPRLPFFSFLRVWAHGPCFLKREPSAPSTWSLFAASPQKIPISAKCQSSAHAALSCWKTSHKSVPRHHSGFELQLPRAQHVTLFPCGQVLLPQLWGRGLQTGGHQNQLSVFMSSDLLPSLTLATPPR